MLVVVPLCAFQAAVLSLASRMVACTNGQTSAHRWSPQQGNSSLHCREQTDQVARADSVHRGHDRRKGLLRGDQSEHNRHRRRGQWQATKQRKITTNSTDRSPDPEIGLDLQSRGRHTPRHGTTHAPGDGGHIPLEEVAVVAELALRIRAVLVNLPEGRFQHKQKT